VTQDNRRAAIALEVRHCERAFTAARALRDMGLYNDALSRLYYALFHAMTALLLTQGVEPRRHRALAGLLGTHFVATGALTAADTAVVARAASFRELADYERTWEATADITAAAFAEIEPLIERAQEILRGGGWLPPPSGLGGENQGLGQFRQP
jgi:uncharacterized protein (UPF0332 family)